MLRRALSRRAGRAIETLHSDSLYAINMTMGKWMPRKQANQTLMSDLGRIGRRLQRQRPHEVRMQHVHDVSETDRAHVRCFMCVVAAC